MDTSQVEIQVQVDGKYLKTISVRDDANKTMIENAALKAAGKSSLNAKVTIVPGRLANVIPL
jgi:hypothetical protein